MAENEIVALPEAALDAIAGGQGSMIDPDGRSG
jgi:hypothetical protein